MEIDTTEDLEIDIDELLISTDEDEVPTDVIVETLNFESQNEYEDEFDTGADETDSDSNSLPKQLRCVSHTLNLIGTDFDKH